MYIYIYTYHVYCTYHVDANYYITGTKVSTYGGLSQNPMNMYRGEAEMRQVRFTRQCVVLNILE